MDDVPEQEHRKERFVDNLLRCWVLCKVAAGGIDDGDAGETQQKVHNDKLEDGNVCLSAQFSACRARSRPWGLGIKCLVRC